VRLALISDIHSNLVALDSTVKALENAQVDDVVCLGDVVSMGPHPRAVLERVREIDCPVVMGNCDAFMLDPVVKAGDDNSARISAIDAWTAKQLSEPDLEYIRTFRPTLELSLGPYSLLCYHGSPRSFDDIIGSETSDEELSRLLDGYSFDLCAGGHTHRQMFRRIGTSVVVNPGSVGMAYDRTRPIEAIKCAPWTEFAIVEGDEEGLSVELERVSYDRRSVARDIEESGMPHARWAAEGWR
jgi:putative phosphoesterase